MTKWCLLFVGLLQLACNDLGQTVPPELKLGDLLAAPETLTVGGKSLVMSTSLGRNLMPMIPPSGSGLVAVVYLQMTDSTATPESITADVIWVVRSQDIWVSFLRDSTPPRPNVIAKSASDGPEWDGPVDVIVRVIDNGGTFRLLRAANQQVGKVY